MARACELLDAGVDWLQIREKDAAGRPSTGRALHALARRIVAGAGGERVLVNDRLDVALATGCAGVHLTGRSVAPSAVRRIAPGAVVAVSAHSLADARRAEDEGADFVVLGPVFPPSSKTGSSAPLGLPALLEARAALSIPVFALGGVSWETLPLLLGAGVREIAGIALFMRGGARALRRLRSGAPGAVKAS